MVLLSSAHLPIRILADFVRIVLVVRFTKCSARGAGIGEIHLHQLRHSFARMVAERSGSLSETPEALGHKHAATTRVYVQRIAVKRDKFGREIARRLKT